VKKKAKVWTAAEMGKRGAEVSNASRSPEERQAQAVHANEVRYARHEYKTDAKSVYQREYQRRRRERLKREREQ